MIISIYRLLIKEYLFIRLLLVEDEIQLSEALTQILVKNKYTVDNAFNGVDGLDNALTGIYDLIILDIMLPKLNGLDLGTDDYLVKPFSSDELLARIRSLTRRRGELINNNILSFGDIELNLSTYELLGTDSSINLTLKEFELLEYFMGCPCYIINKEDLLVKILGYESEVEHNNLEVYISFLRKKLSHIGSKVIIKALRGIGYKMEES